MKTKFFILTFILAFTAASVLAQDKVMSSEMEKITGKWIGKLIYLDYQTNKPYEMPANLEVVRIGKSDNFKFSNTYPNESSANSTDTFEISNEGKLLDNETVKSKKTLPNGDLEIVTEVAGKDGNDDKEALLRHTYLISEIKFEIKKEVLFSGSEQWVLRHSYLYVRI